MKRNLRSTTKDRRKILSLKEKFIFEEGEEGFVINLRWFRLTKSVLDCMLDNKTA